MAGGCGREVVGGGEGGGVVRCVRGGLWKGRNGMGRCGWCLGVWLWILVVVMKDIRRNQRDLPISFQAFHTVD